MSDDQHNDSPVSEQGATEPLTAEEISRDPFINEVRELYNAGVPLFTKEMIRHAQDQISQQPLPDNVDLLGFDGKKHTRPSLIGLSVPGRDETWVPHVRYKSFEALTRPLSHPETSFISVSIGSTLARDADATLNISQDDARHSFDKKFDLWEQSELWVGLKAQIQPHLSTLPKTVDKIIGFGLGEFTRPSSVICGYNGMDRSCAQHSLMITAAKFVEEHTGNSIKCYAQDPAYFDTCKTVLTDRAVEVVEGDRGFLLVDESAIVVSISPNVPVQQIVADLGRPAMMMWNKMSEPEVREWRYDDDVLSWISPYSTDPVSPRVMAMREDYTELVVNGGESGDKLLGDMTMYVRKPGLKL